MIKEAAYGPGVNSCVTDKNINKKLNVYGPHDAGIKRNSHQGQRDTMWQETDKCNKEEERIRL